jgi:uncharacterized protein YbaP (TraB family)
MGTFRFLKILAAIAALCVATLPAHAADKPSPAMWKLESGGSTLYFLGSMHALPQGLEWKTPVIERALGEADVFYFETAVSSGSLRTTQTVLAKESFLPEGQTLTGMMSAKGAQTLKGLVSELRLDFDQINRLRPWSAGMYLGSVATASRKFSYGVDTQVAQFSLSRQKPRRYFETARQQVEMLASLDKGPISGFEEALADIRRAPEMLDRLVIAWKTGNTAEIERFALDGLAKSNQTRRIMLDERNQNWVGQIPTLIRQKRTFFVTVGAAHLIGKGSVIALLCAQDLPVRRIDTASGGASNACPAPRPAARSAA